MLTGYPPPKIFWRRDGEAIDASAEFAIFGNNFLRIKDLIEEDGGMYQGIATNALGMAEITSQLVVFRDRGGTFEFSSI